MRTLFRADDSQLLRNISNWLTGAAVTENETAADFYQRYLGLNLEINSKTKENLLKKYFLRKLRPELVLWMKGDPATMSLDEILKKIEEAEIQLLYRRKEEIQRSLPNKWISTNSDYDKDEGNPQEFTTSLTRQLARLKTPERTVVVANVDAPSSSSTNSSGQEIQTTKSPVFPTNNDRNRPAFPQNLQTNFYERNNNSGGQYSNNNSPRLPFYSNNSPNFNRSNPSGANHNRAPRGPYTGTGVRIVSLDYWRLLKGTEAVFPYSGADIVGPEVSSIEPVGWVEADITLTGQTFRHPIILARKFNQSVLLATDFMFEIGLVLDVQDGNAG
ncbi:unnamed protein product [Didymodactylos carnosus]|uniref:Uncharacterized protein n=1 Tax=Didymodactylos carnosus TaxID=1234261 RepID=A0A8S2WLY2_9BILA|nr:unnamed protein product [Didymodactylos carnosus]